MLERLVRVYSGSDGVDKSSLSKLLALADEGHARSLPMTSTLSSPHNALRQDAVVDSDEDEDTAHDADEIHSARQLPQSCNRHLLY